MPGALEAMAVLLVEDHPADARLLGQMLAAGGRTLDLDHVRRLSEAVDRLRRRSPDLVLLGLDLPDSRGLDTLVVLRAHAPRTPIVALTGPGPEEGVRALRSGAGAYVVKADLAADRLWAAVDTAVARQATLNDVRGPDRSVR